MNDLIVKDNIKIEDLIYEVRGKQEMLDSDLARLYGCKNGTKDINKAVKRNIDRFSEDFYYKITREEYYEILRFQKGTLELEQGKYSKYCFELSMLEYNILRSKISTSSIKIHEGRRYLSRVDLSW